MDEGLIFRWVFSFKIGVPMPGESVRNCGNQKGGHAGVTYQDLLVSKTFWQVPDPSFGGIYIYILSHSNKPTPLPQSL